ncbi:hypothetical protein K523DRAFT_319048 [Schizophyllum commune Tattone D]|nr:hypothetical protein K523DRAFT_319048 [Schizophyllum commune Tattone D]
MPETPPTLDIEHNCQGRLISTCSRANLPPLSPASPARPFHASCPGAILILSPS